MRFTFQFSTGRQPKKPKPISLVDRLADLQRALIAAQEAADQSHADSLLEDIKYVSQEIEWQRRIARELSVGHDRRRPLIDDPSPGIFG